MKGHCHRRKYRHKRVCTEYKEEQKKKEEEKEIKERDDKVKKDSQNKTAEPEVKK